MKLLPLLLLIPIASAQLQLPSAYPEGTCELAAKEFQAKYGGDLVFVFPQSDGKWLTEKNNGEMYLSGRYGGSWLNRVYVKGNNKHYYIDYPNQRIYDSKESIVADYNYQAYNKPVTFTVFIYGQDHIPFNVIHN